METQDYLARDFEAIKKQLVDYANQNIAGWTDFNESEQGMILVELYSLIGDSLHRYIDRQVDELDIDIITQRRNMISLMKLIGYSIPGATPATCDVEFSLEDGSLANNDISIPKGFKVFTKDFQNPITYEVMENDLIPAGQNKITITMRQGETETEYYSFDGTADQSINLDLSPVIENDIEVLIDNEEWTAVEQLLDSTDQDRHYKIEISETDEAKLIFGNGVAGITPNGSGVITYRIGGGVAGQVGSNTLIVPESPQMMDQAGYPVAIATNNPTSSAGGKDKESINEARSNGPAALRANSRTVGPDDFNNHTMEVDGVVRARALFKKDDDTIPQNVAEIQIIPEGGGLITTALKDAVKDYLYNTKPVPTTMVVDPIDAVFKTVDVTTAVVAEVGYDQTDVATRTQTAITEFLSDYTAKHADKSYVLDWNITLYPDDFAIKVEGCRSISVSAPTAAVTFTNEMPKPGTITVN